MLSKVDARCLRKSFTCPGTFWWLPPNHLEPFVSSSSGINHAGKLKWNQQTHLFILKCFIHPFWYGSVFVIEMITEPNSFPVFLFILVRWSDLYLCVLVCPCSLVEVVDCLYCSHCQQLLETCGFVIYGKIPTEQNASPPSPHTHSRVLLFSSTVQYVGVTTILQPRETSTGTFQSQCRFILNWSAFN